MTRLPSLFLIFILPFLCQVFGSMTTSPSISSITSSTSDSSASAGGSNDDRVERYITILRYHIDDFTFKSNYAIPQSDKKLHEQIFTQALNFVLGRPHNFNQVISDPKVSLKTHCLLLEFFVKILELESIGEATKYSPFLKHYTIGLSVRPELFNVPPNVIQNFVFPALKALVRTGNFLNYSMLFPVLNDHFTDLWESNFFKAHIRQYFVKDAPETALEFEIFKLGLEFLNIYFPRYEIYTISNLNTFPNLAFNKPEGCYLILFHPLRSVTSPTAWPLTPTVLSKIESSSRFLAEDSGQTLIRLESELIAIDFLNQSFYDDSNNRKLIFVALFRNINIFLVIKLNLPTVFTAWLHSQSPILDPIIFKELREVCNSSPNPEFKKILDKFY